MSPTRTVIAAGVAALAMGAVAYAAPAERSGSDGPTATSWLVGIFHPAPEHQTLRGTRAQSLDKAGEMMVRMDLVDDDVHQHDFWFYGVSAGAGMVTVRQYWVAKAGVEPKGLNRGDLIYGEGCDMFLKPHGGGFVGKATAGNCKTEIEGRLFRMNRELSLTPGAVTPTVKLAPAYKRKHPDETGTEMYFRSEN